MKVPVFLLAFTAVAQAQLFEALPTSFSGTAEDSRALVAADFDHDGHLDLLVSNSSHQDCRLYLGDGEGGFTESAAGDLSDSGGRSDGMSAADYDGDGWLDLALVNWHGEGNRLFRGAENLAFQRITESPVEQAGSYSETCSWEDLDGDGRLDLYVSNSAGNLANQHYRNTEEGFVLQEDSELVAWGGQSRGVAFADLDGDGLRDLLVTNEGGDLNHPFRQQEPGSWTLDFTSPLYGPSENTMTASWGDVDNDGDLDLFLGNHGQPDHLLLNDGAGGFTAQDDAVFAADTRTFGSAFGDLDNDGDLDLVTTQGWSSNGSESFTDLVYRNVDGQFTAWPDTLLAGREGWSYGCLLADLDTDGALDLAVACWQGAAEANRLARNTGNAGHWLQLDLEGTAPNTAAIGATLRLKATIHGEVVRQMRVVEGQSGYCGQSLRQHVGLGDAEVVDSLSITWPDGSTEVWTEVYANQVLSLVQGVTTNLEDRGALPGGWQLMSPRPNPFNDRTLLSYELPLAGEVRLAVYNLAGQAVRVLQEGPRSAGLHSAPFHAGDLASGTYLAVLDSPGGRQARPLLLLR